ncbi:hypothetical protein [Bartonella sp. HY038]|uniref:hypothetical protein n=1 Tax=Bartonella sp. HY038 TaxID=2759660 RepID=UPI0015FB7BA4|nr:hypothetical protein [Bartonella sp. HY038]
MAKFNISFKILGALFVTAFLLISPAQAQKFENYPATQIYKGKQAKLQLTKDNGGLTFKTRITEAAKKGVNFAGQYSIVEIGCGSSCLIAYVVDLKSGKLFSFPLGGEENYQMQLQYKPNSRLIKVVWNDINAAQNKACVIEYLEMQKDKFKTINRTRMPSDGFCDAYVD